jgi:hypothetical protein
MPATRGLSRLGEPDLLRLHSEVPEGEFLDEQVAVPLSGRSEVEVESLSCRGDHLATGQDHLPGKRSCGASSHGDPVAGSRLYRVWVVVDMDVGKDPKHFLDHCSVRWLTLDQGRLSCDVCNHSGVMDRFHTFEVAGVEGVVALLHERKEVCRPVGALGRGSHEGSFSRS